jgi:hypothetical protein
MGGMRKAGGLIEHTPLFSKTESYVLRAAEVQAGFALCALQRKLLNIFPRTAKGEDNYMYVIPLALMVSAAAQGCMVGLSILYEMMVLSILKFLVDEYMEGVIEKEFSENLDAVRSLIRQLFVDVGSTSGRNGTNGHTMQRTSEAESNEQGVREQHSLEKSERSSTGSRHMSYIIQPFSQVQEASKHDCPLSWRHSS